MGNADVTVILAKEGAVNAGSWLKGYVMLNVIKGGIKAVNLEMTFWGRERAEVEYEEYEDHGEERRTVRRTDSRSRSLIDISLPAADLSFINDKGRVEAGKYQVPFEIQLPDFLPGSMNQTTHDGRCEIKYGLKAILKGSGTLWNYHDERAIILKSKPMDNLPPTPYNASPTTERVNFCCCISRGKISFGARVNETRLSEGSQCDINMSLRNYSSCQVKRVEARLIQEVHWTAGMGHSTRRHDKLVTTEFPSLVQHTQAQGKVDISRVQNELKDIFDEIEKKTHPGTLSVPVGILDSYSGSLVQITHRIELEVKTQVCVDNPTVRIPVFIGQPPRTTAEAAANNEPSYSPPAEEGTLQGPSVNVPEEEIVVDLIDGNPPSVGELIREMGETVSELDLLERKIKNRDWAPVWEKMTPGEYGKVVGLVSGFDQHRAGEALAKEVPSFRCEYVVEAVKAAVDFERTAIVEKLVPFCTDLRENQASIKKQLTEWEQLVTERAFANALK